MKLEAEWSAFAAQKSCSEWRLPIRVAVAIARIHQGRVKGAWSETEWQEALQALKAWAVVEADNPDLYIFEARLAHAASGCSVPVGRKAEFNAQCEASLTKALEVNPSLKVKADMIRKE